MAKPQTSLLVGALRRLAASFKADMAKPNADPEVYGRPKDQWAADLISKSNHLVTTIQSLGLNGDPNGPRVRATRAYDIARKQWEFLTDRVWNEE